MFLFYVVLDKCDFKYFMKQLTIVYDKKKTQLMESNGGMHFNLVNTYLLKRNVNFWGDNS